MSLTKPSQAAVLPANVSRLVLRHPVFRTFDEPFFRISDVERKPVLVIRLDDREASLPLAGMMREFGISPLDQDGIMLGKVERALDYVTGLRIGDRLPSEILTGEASWAADEVHHDRAILRLNLLLLAWAGAGAGAEVGPRVPDARAPGAGALAGMTPDTIASALRRLAARLGGMTAADALARMRHVADEFAHIEALRDQLLRGAQRMGTVLDRLARNFRGDSTHKELLSQVRRLAGLGVADLQARFDGADAAIADIQEVVARPELLIPGLRSRRDGLYARCRAWDPYNQEWATIEAGHNARTWQLAHETYRFLAPRFMTFKEWRSSVGANAAVLPRPGMAW